MQLKIKRFIPSISEIRETPLEERGKGYRFLLSRVNFNWICNFRNCSYKISLLQKLLFYKIVINLRMVYRMCVCDMKMIYMTKLLINKMPSWRGRGFTALDLHLDTMDDRWIDGQMGKGPGAALSTFLGALCLIWRSLLKSKSNFC